MKPSLEAFAQKLVGHRLTKATRNEYLQLFHFGEAQVQNNSGLVLDVGEYTLAVTCFWLLLRRGATLTSYPDLFLPRTDERSKSGFNWKVPGSNLRDQKLKDLISNGSEKWIVKGVKLKQENNGLEICFENGVVLIVVPERNLPNQPEDTWSLFCNIKDKEAVQVTTSDVVFS